MEASRSPPLLRRVTEWVRLEGTTVGQLVQSLCSNKTILETLHRTVSRESLNIPGDRDSSTSLENLFQCSVTHTVKKFIFMSKRNFPWMSFCPLPLVPLLGTIEQSLLAPHL